VMNVTCAC